MVFAPGVFISLAVLVDELVPFVVVMQEFCAGAVEHDAGAAFYRNFVKLHKIGVGGEADGGIEVVAVGAEDDGLVVGAKIIGDILCRVGSQTGGFTAGSGYYIDVEIAVAVGGEGNLFPVIAPNGVAVIGVVGGEGDCGAAGGRYFEEGAFITGGDEFPVGSEGGLLDRGGLGFRKGRMGAQENTK